MIERQGNKRIIICDVCEEDFEPYDSEDFSTMIAAAKGEGWEIRPDGEGHYVHRCSACTNPKGERINQARRMFGL